MIKLLKKLDRRDWLFVLASVAFIVVQVWMDLKIPEYMSAITRLVQSGDSTMGQILGQGGWMMLCALGSMLSSVVVSVFAARIASNFGAALRASIFGKVQSFSMEEINSFSTASLITRSTNDITQVQMLIVMGLQIIVKAPITAVWAIAKISGKSQQWTMSTGLALIALLVVVVICISLALPKIRKLQKLTDDLNRVTRENLNGLNVVRAYNAEGYQRSKFEETNNDVMKTNLFANKVMATLMPSISLVMSGLGLAIYWIGAVLINSAGMMQKLTLFSDMIVYSSYAMQILMSFMMLVMIFILLPRASVSAKRILQVLETKPSVVDMTTESPEVSDNLKGDVEFRHVSFKYPDAEEYVIHDVSFKAHKGETVAFIGSTGCGKSTIINLVPRFYDATDGQVLVDGVDVRNFPQKELHNKIGYVSQKAILFTGSVESNVSYGDSGKPALTEQEIAEAVEVAQAKDFVENLQDGYQGFVSQGGTNLSGGQKQRISIARAVAKKPEIFIFDDSFSALDYKTDNLLRKALKKDCRDATKLIVAQRIGTIKDADQIVVVDDGKVVGIGTHDELMAGCQVYQQIAYSQLSKEELA